MDTNFGFLGLCISVLILNGCSSGQETEPVQSSEGLVSVEEIERLVQRIPDEGKSSVPFRQLFESDKPVATVETSESEAAEEVARVASFSTPRTIVEPPRLVGVNLRLGRAEAYFVEGEEMHLVKVGEVVGRNYRVLAIYAEEVRVRDLSSGLQRRIEIKGNE